MSGTWDQAQNALAVIDYSKILVWLATQGVTLVSGAVSAYWVHGHMDAEKRMEGMIHHWEYLLASLTPTQKAMIEQRDPGAIDDLEILLQDLKGKMAFLAVRLKAASNWQRLWPCSEISRDIKDMADAFNKANHDFLVSLVQI
ncbi:hypothetical protein C8Q78DRAFT_1073558 [Trametes maxima]|nr:hypothetical protein C8Q78DRAFT_1073558 [Trametes maxima]